MASPGRPITWSSFSSLSSLRYSAPCDRLMGGCPCINLYRTDFASPWTKVCRGGRLSSTSIAAVGVVLIAPVTLGNCCLCMPLRSLIAPTCFVFGHHTIDPWVTMDLITLVYIHRGILGLSAQFFPHILLHLPRAIDAFLAVFSMCVIDVSLWSKVTVGRES